MTVIRPFPCCYSFLNIYSYIRNIIRLDPLGIISRMQEGEYCWKLTPNISTLLKMEEEADSSQMYTHPIGTCSRSLSNVARPYPPWGFICLFIHFCFHDCTCFPLSLKHFSPAFSLMNTNLSLKTPLRCHLLWESQTLNSLRQPKHSHFSFFCAMQGLSIIMAINCYFFFKSISLTRLQAQEQELYLTYLCIQCWVHSKCLWMWSHFLMNWVRE